MIALMIILTGILYLDYVIESLTIPLFLVFLILQLTKVITWSWVCVCLPLIVLPIAIILQFVLIASIAACAENC